MANRYSRQEFLERLWGEIKAGKPLLMTGAGNGIAAKFIERGGVDIIEVIPQRFADKVPGGGQFLPNAAVHPLQAGVGGAAFCLQPGEQGAAQVSPGGGAHRRKETGVLGRIAQKNQAVCHQRPGKMVVPAPDEKIGEGQL